MKIVKEMVQKLMVSDIKGLDPIAIYLEDQGPGRGKITFTCYDQAWTGYWGAMGEGYTIASFISSCDNDYLIKKISSIPPRVDDPDKLQENMKKEIIVRRKAGDFDKETAREYFDEVDFSDVESLMANHDLLYKVYGDEWWCLLPKMPNSEYEYLCRILTAIKEALK